jgi:iron complex outermembrane receptor protein
MRKPLPMLLLAIHMMLVTAEVLQAQVPRQREAAPDTAGRFYELAPMVLVVTRARQELVQVPQAVSVVGVREIQFAQHGVSVDEAVRSIPGVFASNRYNPGEGDRLSIRAPYPAIGTRGVQIVQDGVPLTTADGTTSQPNNLDLGSAGRIEVIRGPSSVLYGNSAGGVISVETEFPVEGRTLLTPEFQLGSYGFNRLQVKASGTRSGTGYVVNLSRMESDGHRKVNGAEVWHANGVVRKVLSGSTDLRGVLNFSDMPFGGNASTLNLEDARNNPTMVRTAVVNGGLGKSVRQGQAGLAVRHDFADQQSLSVLGWGMQRDNLVAIPPGVNDLGRKGAGLRSQYEGRANVSRFPLQWTTGFDVSYQKDDRLEYLNRGEPGLTLESRKGALQLDQLETVRSFGPFAQVTVTLRPVLQLTAGLRYDSYDFEAEDRLLGAEDQSGSRTLAAWSQTVGVTYAPARELNLYGSFATAYKTPTTVELSNQPTGVRGFNQQLMPESWRSFELGVRGVIEDWRLRYEVAGYMATVDSALATFEDDDGRDISRNAGQSSRDGAEVSLQWVPTAQVEARLAYTYQDFQYVRFVTGDGDFSGEREPGAPPHSVFVGLACTGPFGLRSNVDFRWVDAYPVNDANTVSNWAYKVVDLRLGLDRGSDGLRVRPFFGVDNLFNERYNASTMLNGRGGNYFEPAPDRAFYAGFTTRVAL